MLDWFAFLREFGWPVACMAAMGVFMGREFKANREERRSALEFNRSVLIQMVASVQKSVDTNTAALDLLRSNCAAVSRVDR